MIKPESASEYFLFSTVRLETTEGTGTGFIFFMKDENSPDKIVPVIVTNKHVVNNNREQKVKFSLHVLKEQGIPSDENINIEYDAKWFFHPDANIDICCTPLGPLLFNIKRDLGKDIFYAGISEKDIPTDEQLRDLEAIEDVVMVGYPIGLFDEKNNLPLIRKGITASHPSEDFNQNSIGVVDIASFPGSSGSPVFLYNQNGYSDKKGGVFLGTKRTGFLGILYAGPVLEVNGNIEIKEIPTNKNGLSKTNIMINLGYYIKAKELLVLGKEVFKIIKNNTI